MRAWAFQTRAPSVRNLSPPHSYRINGRRADWRPRMASKWEPPARGGSQLPPAAEASIHFGLARREGWRASECTCRAKWVAEEAGRPAEAGPPAAGAGSLAGPLLRQSVAGAGVPPPPPPPPLELELQVGQVAPKWCVTRPPPLGPCARGACARKPAQIRAIGPAQARRRWS